MSAMVRPRWRRDRRSVVGNGSTSPRPSNARGAVIGSSRYGDAGTADGLDLRAMKVHRSFRIRSGSYPSSIGWTVDDACYFSPRAVHPPIHGNDMARHVSSSFAAPYDDSRHQLSGKNGSGHVWTRLNNPKTESRSLLQKTNEH